MSEKAYQELKKKLEDKTARVAVMGLGYVGFPLAVTIAQAGFAVFGTDIRKNKATEAGREAGGLIEVGTALNEFAPADVIVITVPTPLSKTHTPDLSHVIAASQEIARQLTSGQLVILESTSYPGTTEEILLPRLSKNGLEVGRDIFVAFSPERVDPGNARFNIANTPKLVGGVTERCTEAAALFYSQFIEQVQPVSSTRVAEMAKLLENIYRSVNVALVNELTLLCDRMDIDVWEVVEAASTKPFGFSSFSPGPGLGGHCIPVDPFYLAWKAREYQFHTEFIELAGKINEGMPYYVVDKVVQALNAQGKSVHGSRVLVLGVAYKKNVSDIREAPAIKIIDLLGARGGTVAYHDSYVPKLNVNGNSFSSAPLTKKILNSSDVAVIVTDHSDIDYKKVVKESRLIVDTRNSLAGFSENQIVRI